MGLFNIFKKKGENKALKSSQKGIIDDQEPFQFNGDWNFEYKFKAFEGFLTWEGIYPSKKPYQWSSGTVDVTIEDALDDETDPLQEQLNALNYLIQNPSIIKNALFHALDMEYAHLIDIYGCEEEDEETYFPVIKKLDDYRKTFSVGSINIMRASRDGFAYVGVGCACTWDEEHGLGFLMHKNRIIEVGQVDTSFSGWAAYKDNGTLEQVKAGIDDLSRGRVPLPKPKIYTPNPRYNKLKPSQIDANRMYEHDLIKRGYNQDFIDLVEEGKVDINNTKAMTTTFLERAAQSNNEEIILYIISKKPDTLKGALHSAAAHRNKKIIEVLLQNGVDINEEDHWKNTAYSKTKQTLDWLAKEKDPRLAECQEFLNWLISKGARQA